MAEKVKYILAKPIQTADQVMKAADEAASFRQECSELKSKASKLADLLRQAARSSSDLYERPTYRIVEESNLVLEKALSLALKCRSANGILKRAFTIIPAAAFRKIYSQLENSVGDISWLLRVSSAPSSSDHDYIGGLPPIAANEPILCLIWEQIAMLHKGSLDERAEAAAALVSLARDNDRYGKLIIEEGGVVPLLKLLKEGKLDGQENTAKAIGLLGSDSESTEYMINAGVCQVFAKILKEGQMRVQAVVAWAVSELAAHHPKCQDLFAQHNVVRLLVSHLAFETIQDHSKYVIVTQKGNSIHNAVVAIASSNNNNSGSGGAVGNSKPTARNNSYVMDDEDPLTQIPHPGGIKNSKTRLHNVITSTMTIKGHNYPGSPQHPNGSANQVFSSVGNVPSGKSLKSHHHHSNSLHNISGFRARELEDPATKANMKAMAARALWLLAKGNSAICRSITESRALLCFAVLLEKGTDEIKSNSAMALMEITAVAEKDSDLRRSAFKPNSPACKAVVDQLLKIIENPDSDLLEPCVQAIGNLARTFRATETRMISPLVALLDEREPEVSREAADALTKFAGSENYLHLTHSQAIIEAGGVKHLVQLVYFGDQMTQTPALVLLAYIAKHVPDSEELAQNQVLNVLDWASKQGQLIQDESREKLLLEAKSRVELYQSRGSG